MLWLAAGGARRGLALARRVSKTVIFDDLEHDHSPLGGSGRRVPVGVRRLGRRVMLWGVRLRGKAPVEAPEAPEPWTVDPEFQKKSSGVAHALTRDVNQITHDAGDPPPLDLELDRKCLGAA